MKWLHSGRATASIQKNVNPMRLIILFLALVSTAVAQRPTPTPLPTPTPTPNPQQPTNATRQIWSCTLPGGTYQVAVPAMLSVSSHEYVVDGAARVTEVNVDTAGSLVVRFYYIEPAATSAPGGIGAATFAKVQGMLADAADRSGTDAWKKVVKTYPATTHARTVEFRLASKDSLNKILASASKSLASGKADTVTVTE